MQKIFSEKRKAAFERPCVAQEKYDLKRTKENIT